MLCDMDLDELARLVKLRRQARRWSVEEAARHARINRATWKRIEDGLGVRDTTQAAVIDLLELNDPDPFTTEEATQTAEIARRRLDPRLADFTDHELVEEIEMRLLLMASRLHATGSAELAFVLDEDGHNVVTSKPLTRGSRSGVS